MAAAALTGCALRQFSRQNGLKVAERRTIGAGVAERLSAYLQVLTQAKKMGKQRISSKEISAYTNINATQIRRDLSAFGKFGKRGVGYSVEHLRGVIGEILLWRGEHGIALVGAGRLGQAIASSPIFAEQGITIAAIFDRDPARVGRQLGRVTGSDSTREDRRRRAGRPRGERPAGGERARRGRRQDHPQPLLAASPLPRLNIAPPSLPAPSIGRQPEGARGCSRIVPVARSTASIASSGTTSSCFQSQPRRTTISSGQSVWRS